MPLFFLLALICFFVGAVWNPPRVSLLCLGLAFLTLWLKMPQVTLW